MVTQIEREVYEFHHRQELMQAAQSNRDLTRIRISREDKNTGISSLIISIRNLVTRKDLDLQNQSIRNTGNKRKLISS
jgi:hypothetical protein